MATVIPGLDSTVSDLGLSNNIYVLSDKQDATAYQQPSLNQPAANKILKSEGKKSQSVLKGSPRNRILEIF